MRRFGVGVLVLLAIVGLALSVMAGKPVVQAHGELWTELQIFGEWFRMQFAFNVQDRGEVGDHGTISLRMFDHWTGKLVAVGVSTDVIDVYQEDGWVYFSAAMRVARLDEDFFVPIGPAYFLFWALDGGDAADEFGMLGIPLPVLSGKITVK